MPEKQSHADYLAERLRRLADERAGIKRTGTRTLADYIGDWLTPVLIMALIGSLVFFLIDVAYSGDFTGRLRWVLFFYVFGAVLIGRISLEAEISARAPLYSLLLGGAIFIALTTYVEYPAGLASFAWMINLAFIVLIWWCAGKLTRDCHFEDDDEEASGKGLLQAAGIEDEKQAVDKPPPGLDTFADPTKLKLSPMEDPSLSWWDRFRQYREERKRRPRTPGIWIVYFSLAALPIFGFGQALIEDEEPRRHAFWMMVYYVASGLGLLLTTCFLGLRRYLRQRGLQMPAPMAGAWMGIGAGFVLALLVAGALLPRPSDEYPIIPWSRIGSQEREASDYAMQQDSPGKDKGASSNEAPKDKDQKADDGNGAKRDNDAKNQVQGKDNPGGQQGKNSQGSSKGNQKGDSSGNQNKSGDDRSSSKKDDPKSPPSKDDGKKGDKSSQGDDKKQDSRAKSDSSSRSGSKEQRSGSRSGRSSSSTPRSPSAPNLGKLGNVVKWVVYVLLALAAVYVLFRFGWKILKQLAQFTLWARRLVEALQSLWQSLFGWLEREPAREKTKALAEEREVAPPRPFSSYGNPFADGRAERMAPAQLIRYSYEALQAWAREAGMPRETGETPSEFLRRLSEQAPPLEGELKGLESIYLQVAYAGVAATSAMRRPLRDFWGRLTDVADRPLSAGARDSV
jgi:hypothetical protein